MKTIRILQSRWKICMVFIVLLLAFCLANNTTASAASVSSKTPSEVVEFLEEDMKYHSKDYGAGLCLKYISDVYGKMGFDTRYNLESAINYWNILKNEGKAHYDALENVPIGADVFFDAGANFGKYGHVGIYVGDGYIIHNRTMSETDYGVVKQKISNNTYYTNCYLGWAWHDWVTIADEVQGTPMSVGYDRVLPDGDYIIAAAADWHYFLDIAGTAFPAGDHENVQLWQVDDLNQIVDADVWTLTYNESNKFYTIRQKGTNMCLDVAGNGLTAPTNVQVFHDNNDYITHHWAISRAGETGYRVQSRSGTFSLDMSTGLGSGVNVRQWKNTESRDEKWLFIPYKPAQPIEEGRYVLLYTENPSHELDVLGDSGDVSNNTQVQIWNDDALSQFNSFDFIKLSNGYYKVRHAASGKCLDVTGGSTNYKAKAAVYDDNGSIAQQWAVVPNGAGYSLIARCNGYALDLPDGTLSNGTAIEVYPRLGNNNQRWSFVQAEKSIWYYAADAESGVPATQTKYYKTPLTISEQVPVQTGYTFQYWENLSSLNANLEAPRYYPGDTYTEDHPMALYAVWETDEYTITYNANGGTGAPKAVTVEGGAATLSTLTPTRAHHRFLGWAESADASQAQYRPGGSYSGGTVTLYAVWERVLDNLFILPGALTVIEDEAFLDSAADAVMVPATVTEIGSSAFGDVAIYGYAGSYAETWARANGKTFLPLSKDWVLADQVPQGARVTDEKWTYQKSTTETTTSTEAAIDGWTQGGFTWVESGSGVYEYANFPSGFDHGHELYASYSKAKPSDGNIRREYGSAQLKDYIYWHWTYVDKTSADLASGGYNVPIEDAYKLNVYTNGVYRDYTWFDAFETAEDQGTKGPRRPTDANPSTTYDFGRDGGFYFWRNQDDDASQWWWRFDVYSQPYTEYQKLFTYTRTVTTDETSAVPVAEGGGISRVLHWVKYEM